MDKNKVNKYFQRLKLDRDIEKLTLDWELLKTLQYAHVTNIPYENIDILRNIPLNLDNDALFEKMIVNERGGYCFEINSLFNWLLNEIGFKTTNYMARYLRNEPGVPMRRHRVIIAESGDADGKIMCDAGIGDKAPRWPLILQYDAIQEQFGETYKFIQDDFYGWLLCDHHNGSWRPFFSFTEERQLDIDYVTPSFYCEKHPDSPFNKTNITAIKTSCGRKTISDMTFRVFTGEDVSEITIKDDTELREILLKHFNIKI